MKKTNDKPVITLEEMEEIRALSKDIEIDSLYKVSLSSKFDIKAITSLAEVNVLLSHISEEKSLMILEKQKGVILGNIDDSLKEYESYESLRALYSECKGEHLKRLRVAILKKMDKQIHGNGDFHRYDAHSLYTLSSDEGCVQLRIKTLKNLVSLVEEHSDFKHLYHISENKDTDVTIVEDGYQKFIQAKLHDTNTVKEVYWLYQEMYEWMGTASEAMGDIILAKLAKMLDTPRSFKSFFDIYRHDSYSKEKTLRIEKMLSEKVMQFTTSNEIFFDFNSYDGAIMKVLAKRSIDDWYEVDRSQMQKWYTLAYERIDTLDSDIGNLYDLSSYMNCPIFNMSSGKDTFTLLLLKKWSNLVDIAMAEALEQFNLKKVTYVLKYSPSNQHINEDFSGFIDLEDKYFQPFLDACTCIDDFQVCLAYAKKPENKRKVISEMLSLQ